MKKLFFAVCFSAAALCLSAQQLIKGEGVGSFTALTLVGNMQVEVETGATPAIEIELQGVDAKQITWSVGSEGMTVRYRPTIKNEGTVKVKISCQNLESLSSNGAEVKLQLKTGMFTVDMSSGAKLTAQIDCTDIAMRLTGNSAAQLSGSAKYAAFIAGQRSKIDAREMEAVSVTADANMGGEVTIWGTERIVAHTNTGSSIFYKGAPEVLRIQNKMGGTVNNIGK